MVYRVPSPPDFQSTHSWAHCHKPTHELTVIRCLRDKPFQCYVTKSIALLAHKPPWVVFQYSKQQWEPVHSAHPRDTTGWLSHKEVTCFCNANSIEWFSSEHNRSLGWRFHCTSVDHQSVSCIQRPDGKWKFLNCCGVTSHLSCDQWYSNVCGFLLPSIGSSPGYNLSASVSINVPYPQLSDWGWTCPSLLIT